MDVVNTQKYYTTRGLNIPHSTYTAPPLPTPFLCTYTFSLYLHSSPLPTLLPSYTLPLHPSFYTLSPYTPPSTLFSLSLLHSPLYIPLSLSYTPLSTPSPPPKLLLLHSSLPPTLLPLHPSPSPSYTPHSTLFSLSLLHRHSPASYTLLPLSQRINISKPNSQVNAEVNH